MEGPRGKPLVGRVVIGHTEADLAEFAAAGTAAGSLTGGLHGGKKQTDENADDRDYRKQLHERKRIAIPVVFSMPLSRCQANL